MKTIAKVISIFAMSLVLASCGSNNDVISSLENEVSSLEGEISSLEGDISSLESEVGSLEGEISSLESENSSLENEISSLGSKITDLEGNIVSLEEELNGYALKDGMVVTYSEYFDSLIGKATITQPTNLSYQGELYASAVAKVYHPSTTGEGYDPLVTSFTLETSKTEYDFEVPYHGLFSLQVDYTFGSGEGEKVLSNIQNITFAARHYNMGWLSATLPALLFAGEMSSKTIKEGFTYVEIERAKTYDFTKLSYGAIEYPQYLSASHGNHDQSSISGFWGSILGANGTDLCYQWIKELIAINPASTFTFYTVDNTFRAAAKLAFASKLNENNFDIVIYTDGSYSTSGFTSNFTSISDYDTKRKEYLALKDRYAAGEDVSTLVENYYSVVAADDANVRYVVNDLSGWDCKGDSKLQKKIDETIEELPLTKLFSNVREAKGLKVMEYLLRTRWGDGSNECMSSYFDGTPTKNLLILGTSPAGEANTVCLTFDKYVSYIKTTYGDDYKLFYKGHPRYPADETRKTLLDNNNIVELEATIPVETLMILYDDVYVGGYSSTSFQSSLVGQTLFFFGTVDSISSNTTLKSMIEEESIFVGTKFLTKDSSGEVEVTYYTK